MLRHDEKESKIAPRERKSQVVTLWEWGEIKRIQTIGLANKIGPEFPFDISLN